jgi:hypothetical protein
VVLSSSGSNPELLLATQPLLATSGGISGDQFQGTPNPPDVLLAGTKQPSLWSSAAEAEDEDEDHVEEEELALQTPPAASKASACRECVGREAEVSGGWQKVLPRHSLRH